jgi:SAM-dependent methyltransferase
MSLTDTMPLREQEERILKVYRGDDRRSKEHLYRWNKADVLYTNYRFRVEFARIMLGLGWSDLERKDVLDVGCGTGEFLRALLEAGAEASNLHGIDLLPERIEQAKRLVPAIDYRVASAWPIPFDDASIDLATANLVFSSITDAGARAALAAEMWRVTRPGGALLVWDFWVRDPRNPETVGITTREVRRMFPGRSLERHSVLLAPPILRRAAPLSSLLTMALETLAPFLRTHVVYLIRK